MACSRAILTAILAGVIAACGGSPAPSPPSSGAATDVAGVATASPTTAAHTSFAATDSPRSPSPAPTARTAPISTPVPLPPKPTGVTFDEQRSENIDPTRTEITQSVTWLAPRSDGIEIRAYGVTACLARPADPSPDTSGPCLVTHTLLPASVRTLLGTAPASDGVVSWTWTGTFDCEIGLAFDPRGPAYHAVVVAAYSASGHSIFAIAQPGGWWEPGLNDIVC
jgi:hypothetical protein